MYKVTKLFRVPIGHRLSKHEGLCKNIHGHNLKIEVTLKSENLNKNDMVIDFHKLKEIVNGILKEFDHCLLLNSQDKQYLKELSKVMKVFLFDSDPTAEVFSRYLFNKIKSIFEFLYVNKELPSGIEVDSVRVWENDDSVAEYSEG